MEPDEQLEWERRAGRPAGIATLIAGGALLVGVVLSARAAGDDAFETYLNIHDDPSLILLPNIVQAIGYLLTAYGLWYLVRATTPRRTELATPSKIMVILGPVATAIALVLTALAVLDVAQAAADVVRPPRAEKARDDVLEDLQKDSSLITAATIVTYVSRLAFGFALVLAALNGMRAGLLSRFLGILGIIGGVLSVLFGGAGVILAFWLVALGIVFMDRWPNGRGPAWDAVEAIPWPSAADQRAALEEEYADEGEIEEEDEDVEQEEEAEPAAQPHPVSKKRKRKRRG